jgi:hypothetical protein
MALPVMKSQVKLWFATGPLKLKNERPIQILNAKHATFALHQEASKK